MFTTISTTQLNLLSPNAIKDLFHDSINDLAKNIDQFSSHPGHDFTRQTRLGLLGLIQHLVCMGSKDMRSEITDLIPLDVQAYSDSAVSMARRKLDIKGMEYLFHNFSNKLNTSITVKGYRLCDVDGTDLNIYLNPDDPETYVSQKNRSGYNQLHINVAYDPLSHIVKDIEIGTKHKKEEVDSFIRMYNRWDVEDRKNYIFVCDRGYICYRIIDILNKSGAKFIIRAKDFIGKSMFSGMDLPFGEFDMQITRILTRKHNNRYLMDRNKYACLLNTVQFDFPEGVDEYPLSFRLVRVQLSTGEFELLVTNLSEEEFSTDDIKVIYNLRWPIELNNREVKYDINLVNLHSKKQSYIRQEIYARYILLNLTNAMTFASSFILRRIPYSQRTDITLIRSILDRINAGETIEPCEPPSYAQYSDEPLVRGIRTVSHSELPVYKIDFSTAASTVKQFMRSNTVIQDELIIARIIKFLVLNQPGRLFARDVKPQSAKGFLYRGC